MFKPIPGIDGSVRVVNQFSVRMLLPVTYKCPLESRCVVVCVCVGGGGGGAGSGSGGGITVM